MWEIPVVDWGQGKGEECTSLLAALPLSRSPHVPSGGHDLHGICIRKNRKKHNANNAALEGASERLGIPRGAALCGWHPVGIEAASPRDGIDEVICDYVGTAIIRHNYYYCQGMGNTSLGEDSVTVILPAYAGSKCAPKDHFHSNLIFSWSVFDYQSWNIKYRLETERCWKLKFTGGARLCPWETTSNAGQMLQRQGRTVPSYKEATTEARKDG